MCPNKVLLIKPDLHQFNLTWQRTMKMNKLR